jgi:hypothetical protein
MGVGPGTTIPDSIRRLEVAAASAGARLPVRGSRPGAVTANAGPDAALATAATLVPADALARRPGVADLLVVRERTRRYELGEVAHIENALKGEARERTHRHSTTTENVTVTETETTTSTEQEIQSTERFDLQREATSALHEDSSLETGLTVTASFGPSVSTSANVGYAANHSKDEAAREASTFARQVTQRAVARIQERMREERTSRTVEVTEETNRHAIDNSNGTANVVGIYRWVDKVIEAQVFNYGRRLLLEFVVPEPAAFYLHRLATGHETQTTIEKPEPPLVQVDGKTRPLEPGDLTLGNYMAWVERYSVGGVSPPPAPYETIALAWEEPPPNNQHGGTNRFYYKAKKELVVPDDFRAVRTAGTVYASAWRFDTYLAVGTTAMRASEVGTGDPKGSLPWKFDVPMSGEVGEIPVALHIADCWGYTIALEVLCERTAEAFAKWQLATFESIERAYLQRLSQYDDALAAAEAARGFPLTGRNPFENRLTERAELKRNAIAMLSGQRFEAFDAVDPLPPENFPEVDLAAAAALGPIIQFFEQSLEWPQVTYTFYPYFWGRRKNWVTVTETEDRDPLFESFLQAGAARVVVPVRPGFEDLVLHYLATGEIWDGGQVPQVGDPLYVSLVQEIQEARGLNANGEPVGDPWELRMPTTLIMLAADATLPAFP